MTTVRGWAINMLSETQIIQQIDKTVNLQVKITRDYYLIIVCTGDRIAQRICLNGKLFSGL